MNCHHVCPLIAVLRLALPALMLLMFTARLPIAIAEVLKSILSLPA